MTKDNLRHLLIYPLIVTVCGGVILLLIEHKGELFGSKKEASLENGKAIQKAPQDPNLDATKTANTLKKIDSNQIYSYLCDKLFSKPVLQKMSELYQRTCQMVLKGKPYKEKDYSYGDRYLVNYKDVKIEQEDNFIASRVKIGNYYYHYIVTIDHNNNGYLAIEERAHGFFGFPYLRIEFHPIEDNNGRLFADINLNFDQRTRLDFESAKRKTIELIEKIDIETKNLLD
jgi:hypothetical protein